MTPELKKPGRCQLYQRSELFYFDKAHQHGLESRLRRNDRATSIGSLRVPQELQLDEHGQTLQGGYRYTSTSFRQLCRILAAGASTFLRDIAGKNPSHDGRHCLSNSQLARNLFNAVVDMRFPLLEAYRLVRDDESKLIEGVIGSKHFTLLNSTFYAQAQSAVSTTGKQIGFHSAVLSGRRMLLWYRSRQPFLTLQVGSTDAWNFYSGYFFCNGEARGTSARGTMAIFCKCGICLGPYHIFGDRVSHIGRDFHRRLDKMFGKVFSKEVPVEQARSGLTGMLSTPLGCNGLDVKELRVRVKKLVRVVTALSVPQRIAEQVIDDALYVGHKSVQPGAAAPLSYSQDRVFATRTMFDVFARLIRSAGRMNLGRREVLEQAAWQMLTGD